MATPKEMEKMTPEEFNDVMKKIVEKIEELNGQGCNGVSALNLAVTRVGKNGHILDRENEKWRDATFDRMTQETLESARRQAQENASHAPAPKEPGIVTMVGVRRSENISEVRDGGIVRKGVYKEKIRPGAFANQGVDRHELQLPPRDRPDAD